MYADIRFRELRRKYCKTEEIAVACLNLIIIGHDWVRLQATGDR